MIRLANPSRDEPIRSIDMVLHMSDGTDQVISVDDDVLVVQVPEPQQGEGE